MDLSKMILLYLCIAIACVFWQPSIVLGDSKQAETVLNMFNIDMNNYNTLSGFNQSTDASNSLLKQGTDTQGSSILLNLIDGLFNAMGYIILVFRAILSPVIIMVAGAFPIEITYALGIPLVVLFIISVVRFVRGY